MSYRMARFGVCLLSTGLLLGGLPAAAQIQDNQDKTLSCDEHDSDRFCEIRETVLAPTGQLEVNASPNGGISVKGWSRNEVLVRAKVVAQGKDQAGAKQIASQVRVNTSAGRVQSEGPSMEGRRGESWSVSYEIFTPHRTDVSADSVNGGVALADLKGRLKFHTTNGGATLLRLAGDVEGHTTNGGVRVVLAGNTWDGRQLDVHTTNGGASVSVPDGYNAQLEASTVNGGMKIDFPVTLSGDISKSLRVKLGAGGPPIRVGTTNGGVSIRRAGA
jgi:DUF4097 and DUF4098 domain-containing protein YvlB